MQLLSWMDGGEERVVAVEDAYDPLSVARAVREDLGVDQVCVAGRPVFGQATQRDREMFDRWSKGEPPQDGRG